MTSFVALLVLKSPINAQRLYAHNNRRAAALLAGH